MWLIFHTTRRMSSFLTKPTNNTQKNTQKGFSGAETSAFLVLSLSPFCCCCRHRSFPIFAKAFPRSQIHVQLCLDGIKKDTFCVCLFTSMRELFIFIFSIKRTREKGAWGGWLKWKRERIKWELVIKGWKSCRSTRMCGCVLSDFFGNNGKNIHKTASRQDWAKIMLSTSAVSFQAWYRQHTRTWHTSGAEPGRARHWKYKGGKHNKPAKPETETDNVFLSLS